MIKAWSTEAWDDYVQWQTEGKKTLRRINALIKDIERNGPAEGIGKPEPLCGNLAGKWSRRIDEKNRLVYEIKGDLLLIGSCKTHYSQH